MNDDFAMKFLKNLKNFRAQFQHGEVTGKVNADVNMNSQPFLLGNDNEKIEDGNNFGLTHFEPLKK
jgi:hypothetical protein